MATSFSRALRSISSNSTKQTNDHKQQTTTQQATTQTNKQQTNTQQTNTQHNTNTKHATNNTKHKSLFFSTYCHNCSSVLNSYPPINPPIKEQTNSKSIARHQTFASNHHNSEANTPTKIGKEIQVWLRFMN